MALADISQRPGLLLGAAIVLHVALISAQVNTVSGLPVLQVVTFGSFAELQRLMDGAYTIRATGIYQLDPGAYVRDGGISTPGNRNFRGSIETTGQFALSNKWTWGWDGIVPTDQRRNRVLSTTPGPHEGSRSHESRGIDPHVMTPQRPPRLTAVR